MNADLAQQRDAVRRALRTFVRANKPVILWGPSGIGKTTGVRDLAIELSAPLYEIIPATREPADFGGYPVPDPVSAAVRLRPVGEWHDFAERARQAEYAFLFIDEVAQCTLALQNALLRVVLDKIVGEFPLPKNVRVICAANPPDQTAGGWDLSAAFANRLGHLDWPIPTVAELTAWLQARPAPPGMHDAAMYARHLVTAFLAAQPGLLHALPASDADRSRAWPSPRTWCDCADVLAYVVHDVGAGPSASLVEDGSVLAQATVGHAAAASFTNVLRGMAVVHPEELLADPSLWGSKVVPACSTVNGGPGVAAAWSALVAVTAAVLATKLENGKVPRDRWLAGWEVHRWARTTPIEGDAVAAGAAVAALAIPFGAAALPAKGGKPAGIAHGLPMPQEAKIATSLYAAAGG